MTVTREPSTSAPGGRGGPDGPDGGTSARRSALQVTARGGRAAWAVASTTVWILGAVLLAFSGWLSVGSRLHYDRAQQEDYATFRAELAQAIAPTGPTNPSNA